MIAVAILPYKKDLEQELILLEVFWFKSGREIVAYNGRRFDFTVLKKQSSEYAVESVMDA